MVVMKQKLPPLELKPRRETLGPHFERPVRIPEFEVEVKIAPIKPRHYVFGSILAVVVGLSTTYGMIEVGSATVNKILPPHQDELANYASYGDQQGSDDAAETLDPLSGSYTVLNTRKPLTLSAKDYIVGDLATSDIILEKNGTTTSPMASVTKLMTAVVDLETINQRDYATVTPAALKYYGVRGELVPKEIIRVSDLIYPLLLVSSNAGAEVLADHAGRNKFLKEMNQKASDIGMKNTNYDDASGLSPKSYSTAEDLFRLAKYINENHPDIFDIGRVRQYSILGHTWQNQNHQLVYSTFNGGKNGFTDEAEKTTVSTFNLSFNPKDKNDKRTIAIILLKTNDREGDIAKILAYLSANVRYERNLLDVGNANQPGPKGAANPDQ